MSTIDGDKLMMHLADWWYSSFGQEETPEAKAVRAVMDEVEKMITSGEYNCSEKPNSSDLFPDATEKMEDHNAGNGKMMVEYMINRQAAVEAMRKQIPQKPVIGYAFPDKLRSAIMITDPQRAEAKIDCCPVCGRTLWVSKFVQAKTGLRLGDPYCKQCGQAIDWEGK